MTDDMNTDASDTSVDATSTSPSGSTTAPNVQYDIEVIKQKQNPICWVASCAMVKAWGTQSSVGVGDLTGGFDPSNSCIANLAGSWQECTDLMNEWGFDVLSVSDLSAGSISADALITALTDKGPAVLLHLCNSFPYGSQWGDSSTMSGAHAVIITGVDTDTAQVFFNNPWGDKDQPADLDTVLQKMNSDSIMGKTLGFWRQ